MANKTWACSRLAMARWARHSRRVILLSSNRSLSNPPSPSTTPSFTPRRMKKSGLITTWKSRATFSGYCFRKNRQPYPDSKDDMFTSRASLVVDLSVGASTRARAGHDASLLYRRAQQTVEFIKSPGMVVGIDSGSVFDRITNDFAIRLEQDDCLVLYTDGVTEALDTEGFEFGIDRMIQSVRASAAHGASAIITRLIDDVRNFVGAHPQ